MWQRWPSAGPTGPLSSAADYDGLVEDLIRTGVLADAGMAYFDVRPSDHVPTLELRVCDACPIVDDAVMIAGLFRAAVRQALDDIDGGHPSPSDRGAAPAGGDVAGGAGRTVWIAARRPGASAARRGRAGGAERARTAAPAPGEAGRPRRGQRLWSSQLSRVATRPTDSGRRSLSGGRSRTSCPWSCTRRWGPRLGRPQWWKRCATTGRARGTRPWWRTRSRVRRTATSSRSCAASTTTISTDGSRTRSAGRVSTVWASGWTGTTRPSRWTWCRGSSRATNGQC